MSLFRISYVLLIILGFGLASCKSGQKKYPNEPGKWRKKEQKALIRGVIKSARGYMGTPYKWGGTTRAGMDCSGLLYTCYKTQGVQIPRTSSEQSKFGNKVGKKNVKEGDWVFFAAGKKKRKITHVGIVSKVNGKEKIKFIHASSSLGVVENDLFSNYYEKIYVRAVRPF